MYGTRSLSKALLKEKAGFGVSGMGVVWSRAGLSSEKKPTAAMLAGVLASWQKNTGV